MTFCWQLESKRIKGTTYSAPNFSHLFLDNYHLWIFVGIVFALKSQCMYFGHLYHILNSANWSQTGDFCGDFYNPQYCWIQFSKIHEILQHAMSNPWWNHQTCLLKCCKFQTCLVLDCKFQNFQSSVEGKQFKTWKRLHYIVEKIKTTFLTFIKSSMDTRNSPSFSESVLQTLLLSAIDKDFNSSELSDHAPFHSCLQKFSRYFICNCM